jgi:hypothetical protein
MRKILADSSRVAILFTLITVSLSGCNYPKKGARQTPAATGGYVIQDEASRTATVASSAVNPSRNPTATETNRETSRTETATSSQPLTNQQNSPAPTAICDLAAAGVPIDLSIPDDTPLLPGQPFTKVWRLQNVGGCTWTRDYTVALFSGEGMGAQAILPLPGDTPPGQTVEISVDMIAPQLPGKYQGNWKLRNPSNDWFGIGPNGSAPFWVRIVVEQPHPTAIPTVLPTARNSP